MSKAFELPEELIDKHIPDKSDEAVEEPTREAEEESPEEVAEDNLEEEAEGEAEDNDEDEAGQEDEESDSDEEDQDEEAEDEEDNSDEEPVVIDEAFLPKIDHKKIKESPELTAVYKHMHAAFTKTQMELKAKTREVDSMKEDYESFVEELQSEDGATNFLIQVAMNRPDIYRAALERAEELTEDPTEKKKYEREQDILRREQERKRQERQRLAEEQERRTQEINKFTAKAASRYQMDEAELRVAHRYVANEIYRLRAEGAKDIPEDVIVRAVKQAASDMAISKGRVTEEVKRKTIAEEKQRMKDKLKASKRPPAAKSTSAPARKTMKKFETPKGKDPLMHGIDRLLGLED